MARSLEEILKEATEDDLIEFAKNKYSWGSVKEAGASYCKTCLVAAYLGDKLGKSVECGTKTAKDCGTHSAVMPDFLKDAIWAFDVISNEDFAHYSRWEGVWMDELSARAAREDEEAENLGT